MSEKLREIIKSVIEKTAYEIPVPLLLSDYIAEFKERLIRVCDVEYVDVVDDKSIDKPLFKYYVDSNNLVKVYSVKLDFMIKCYSYVFTAEIIVEILRIPIESTNVIADVVIKTLIVIVK